MLSRLKDLPRSTVISVFSIAVLLLAGSMLSTLNGANANGRFAIRNPLASQSLFARMLEPFAVQAQARREERARTDAGYPARVDSDLAAGRVNFLLFGYGETYEPPFDRAVMGSYTIVSLDMQSGEVSLISLTHDIRAPEIERVLAARGDKVHAVKIDQAYSVGGFDLMRRTVEDATGLPIDFQVSFRDVMIKDVIDSTFGPVPVDVPSAFDTAPFYLDGQEYESVHFAQGPQRMNGTQALQFIKSLEAGPTQSLQRNVRKDQVLRALLTALTHNCSDQGFWLKLSGWLVQEQVRGDVAYDFDPVALVVDNIGRLGSGLSDLFRYQTCSASAPQIAQMQYVVDPQSGGDGVRWAESDATVNPIARHDIDAGVYEAGGLGVAVPLDGNPYGNLVTEYWGSVRALVKKTLGQVK